MKKLELEDVIAEIENIKAITDTLDYNTSTAINKKLLRVLPKLREEYDRLNNDKIDIQSPCIRLIMSNEIHLENLDEHMNGLLKELVATGNKIIDFGVYPNLEKGKSMIYGYITYTN